MKHKLLILVLLLVLFPSGQYTVKQSLYEIRDMQTNCMQFVEAYVKQKYRIDLYKDTNYLKLRKMVILPAF